MMAEILYHRNKDVADDVLETLDKLGYSKALAEKRVQIYENAGKGIGLYETVKFTVDYEIVIAGSRGDGTGIYVDRDVDKLLVQNHLYCLENGTDVNLYQNNSTLFELDTEDVPNGYAKLIFISKADDQTDKIHTNILDALEDKDGKQYLRNDCKLSPAIGHVYADDACGWIEHNLVHANTKSGPSKPYRIRTPYLSRYILLDDVLAFRCVYPTVIDAWCKRERSKGWPTKELVEIVKNLEVYVVPVGAKGSNTEHLEWRLCLTQAELLLVQSFNDTQIKVYGALKIITKYQLTPVCDSITSYIIKTVLFWQLEQTESSKWSTEHFKERLIGCLNYLKTCIGDDKLPNYMIPARNMLQNKISTSDKQNLLEKINGLLKGCPYTVIKYGIMKEIVEADDVDLADVTEENMLSSISMRGTSSSLNEGGETTRESSKHQPEGSHFTTDTGLPATDTDQLKMALRQRMVREQLVLAIFALPSKEIADVLKQLFEEKEQSAILHIISQNVFPFIMRHNPYGFFEDIKSMDGDEIYTVCRGVNVSSEPSCVLL